MNNLSFQLGNWTLFETTDLGAKKAVQLLMHR